MVGWSGRCSQYPWKKFSRLFISPLVSVVIYYLVVWGVYRFGQTTNNDGSAGFSFTNAVYFGTVIMSTVGYGDIKPDNEWTKMATVLLSIVGIVLVFSQCMIVFSAALAPVLELFHRPVKRLIAPDLVTVEGPDGKSFDVTVPRGFFVYYAGHLAPPLIVLLVLQFFFSAVLCAVQPELSFGDALYHTMITSMTVGLGDISVTTTGARWVATLHIFFTVGLMAAIISDMSALRTQRQRLLDRINMILRKCDPDLMDQLHTEYLGAVEEMATEEAVLREMSGAPARGAVETALQVAATPPQP